MSRASWMFSDEPESSLYAQGQLLWTAWTRLLVVAVYRPMRPLIRWIRSKTASK